MTLTSIRAQGAPSQAIEYLDTKDAAAFLGLKPSTLATWRCTRSDGPPFIRAGGRRVVYAVSDLRDWMHTWRRRSTAAPLQSTQAARREEIWRGQR